MSEQALYAIIPAAVMRDPVLVPKAKLLYGEINALCKARGYCVAQNAHFAEILKASTSSISHMVTALQRRGYIQTEVLRDPQTQQVVQRRIWIIGLPGLYAPPGYSDNTSRKYQLDPIANLSKEGITGDWDYNNPPNPPEGGGAEAEQKPKRKRKRVDPSKLSPTWQPERFAGFWAAYPRGNDKARAVEEWDKLPQDKKLMEEHGGDETALLNAIAKGLGRQLKCRQWQEGVGIPYAFRWLRDRKWTEAPDKGSDPAGLAQLAGETPQEAPAERPYHIEIQDGEEVVIYDD